ncbi:EthD domain-containing protein [Paraburkholderia sacchari]|uniref:EthD domain-containing protein n=1 Tax=Paraburkholderia sacchari TaxID=159450 RepID=UPI0039A50ECC
MTHEEFLAYYKDRHGPLMARLMHGKGLVSYEHFPVDHAVTTGRYLAETAPEFDAVSIYTYESKEACEACWSIQEVIEDSRQCMDTETMITLPTGRRLVYPDSR